MTRRRGSIVAVFLFLMVIIIVAIIFPLWLDMVNKMASYTLPMINDTRLQGTVVRFTDMAPYLPILLIVALFVWVLSEAHKREERVEYGG